MTWQDGIAFAVGFVGVYYLAKHRLATGKLY